MLSATRAALAAPLAGWPVYRCAGDNHAGGRSNTTGGGDPRHR
jgi:hypothetical protein